jgi:hypothetical protein
MGLPLAFLVLFPGFLVCPGMSIKQAEVILREESAQSLPTPDGGEVRTYFRAYVAIRSDDKGRVVRVFRLTPALDRLPDGRRGDKP